MLASQSTLRRILIGYWVLIFIGTHIPLEQLPMEMEPGFDKIIHFFLYAPLAFLFAASRRLNTRPQLVKALGILLLYAALDEITQIPVNRSAEFLDWVLDAVGTAVGLWVYARILPVCVHSVDD